MSCGNNSATGEGEDGGESVRLVILDPAHFHAALVQKSSYPGVDTVVHVYGPEGLGLSSYLDLIDSYNRREADPTHWTIVRYTGADFLERMLSEKKGNLVVLAGNNGRKTTYMLESVRAGFHVLADKPMVISQGEFGHLLEAFDLAGKENRLLYDIMTERSEITNALQREIARIPAIFGELEKGSPEDPAVIQESVHFYSKQVSGSRLIRPAWFFDPGQQGDALADVGTHLVDLVLWSCFPEQALDYRRDVSIHDARAWPTPLTLAQFSSVTGMDSFPDYLYPYVRDGKTLETHGNGEVSYSVRGVHVRTVARWEFEAKNGGDTHFSVMKGTKARLEIRQGEEEGFIPVLYVFPEGKEDSWEKDPAIFREAMKSLMEKYEGLELERYKNGWKLIIPGRLRTGHESHFADVMRRTLQYMANGDMPSWEVPNMITKYFITTQAQKLAGQ